MKGSEKYGLENSNERWAIPFDTEDVSGIKIESVDKEVSREFL